MKKRHSVSYTFALHRALALFLCCTLLLAGCRQQGAKPENAGPKQPQAAAEDITETAAEGTPGAAESISEAAESISEAAEGISEAAEGTSETAEAITESVESISEAAESISEAAEALTEGSSESANASLAFTETGEEDLSKASGEDSIPAMPSDAPQDESAKYTAPVFLLIPGYAYMRQYALPVPGHTLTLLRLRLQEMLSTYDGTWSVCVRDLSTGERFVINDIAMPSASMMKLFILGCVYEDIRIGVFERTAELVDQMGNMIRASSNEAANRILQKMGGGDYAAGIAHVNGYIRQAGYSEKTHAYNPFNNEAIRLDDEHVNQTSAADCAELLERVYRRLFAVQTACNETEQMLLNQATRYKIPSVIPAPAQVANKTGETDTVENDAAIVYTPTGDYILCVFSTGWADKKTAQERIKAISAETYAYHTDPAYARRVFPFPAPAGS